MAGLTKAQRAAKEAAKKEEEVKNLPKKYRHEFNSWDEFNKYEGEKG